MNLTELHYFSYVKKLCSEICIVPRLGLRGYAPIGMLE